MKDVDQKLTNDIKVKGFKLDLLKKHEKVGSLIPLLQSAQDSYGYIPEEAIYYISEIAYIPMSEIYGVITFYSQFRLKPLGKYIIKICEGTACHVNGAKNILKALQNELGISIGETTENGLYTLESVACLGCCSLAPVIMINSETYGNLTAGTISKILKKYRDKEK